MATPIITYESMSREELIRECKNKQSVINWHCANKELDTKRLDFMEASIVEGTNLESGRVSWLADVGCLRETIDECLKIVKPDAASGASSKESK